MNSKKILGYFLKYAVPLFISVGLCYLLFTGIDFRQMMDIISQQCDFRWIAAGLVLAVFSHYVRALRWGIQLRALGIPTSTWVLTYTIFGTYAVNLVLPRLGELWRTGYISARQRAPFTTVFGSMVADRLADTAMVALLIAVTFVLASKFLLDYLAQNGALFAQIAALLSSPWLWLAVVACVAAAWYFMSRKTDKPWIVKIQTAVRELWDGFAVITRMQGKVKWTLLTFLLWGSYFTQTYLAFYAFPFTSALLAEHGIIAPLVTFVFGSIAMGVPSNGGIGPWQWAVIFALSMYGVARPEGSAFANLVLGCNTLLLIALGILTFAVIAFDKKHNTISNSTIKK